MIRGNANLSAADMAAPIQAAWKPVRFAKARMVGLVAWQSTAFLRVATLGARCQSIVGGRNFQHCLFGLGLFHLCGNGSRLFRHLPPLTRIP
jgi:hypothetical protein